MNRLVPIWVLVASACGGGGDAKDPPKPPPPVAVAKPDPAPAPPEQPAGSGSQAGPSTPMVAEAPEGNPPPDGKYEKVMVDGTTVPMINVMDGGKTVLVDTDGVKPRTWEEQYKNKRAKKGQFDLHKTDANKNGKFDDDAIDKEGIWVIDVKGNIVKR